MYKKFDNKTNKPIKEKKTENIADYSNSKVLYTLTKAHSPHTIVFLEDPEDPWFVYVTTFKTKAGTITNSSMITAKDVDVWLSHVLSMGHELKK